jgi:UDP-N-acetylglucosamine--N-acetylmuramyl-(pentapeptide) pyrophosphoryl-undecaprenol N-acetylglucosamine transferase
MANKKIVIAGGGTGGHIFPAIAIAQAIKKIDAGTEFLFVGANGKMEMEKVPQAGFKIEGLDIAGFNRSALLKNISLPYKLVSSFLKVRQIFKTFEPDAAIGVGGYSSFPVLRWAQHKDIPSFIHESNSFAGKANIMLGKKATGVFVATDGMEKFFPPEKITVSGNPVRKSIVQSDITRDQAIISFGLNPAKKTILVVGGSLGAKSINEAIDGGLHKLTAEGFQVIWQTGKPFVKRAREAAYGVPGVWVNEFITEMEIAYAAADLIVSRAGAMAIAEICVVKKPAIFVPYPFAAEDHQTANAKKMESKNAGLLVEDGHAVATLIPVITALMKDEERMEKMKKNLTAMSITNADEIIAQSILLKM